MTVTFIATLIFGAPRFEASLAQWLANFAIAAPALKHPFMDGAYWSLVYEMTFYAWLALFIRVGWFPRYLDVIVTAWMVLAVLNYELHSAVLQRGLLTDQSGFFAAGLVIYEMYRGRRDLTVKLLLALSTVVAIGQSQDLMQWSRVHYQVAFSDGIAAALAVAAIAAVALAVRVQRLPIAPRLVATIGAVTYPLYLLHQHIGYMIFNRLGGLVTPWLLFAATVAAMVLLAFLVQRYVERPGQRALKLALTAAAAQLSAGWRIVITMRDLSGATRTARPSQASISS
jgi:peptidoglycan/LPS O-acetylase OafA/YrhL